MAWWCCVCSQLDVVGNRKAVVIHVPYRLRKAFRKIHVRLVRELEKKFSGKVRHLLALMCFELALSCILLCCGSAERL
jgi:small subunit ribosomal protein S7e